MQLRLEKQQSAVVDEVSAMTAIIRPILQGILYNLKKDVVKEAGGFEEVKLLMLPRLYRQGDGDIGICFEYAVHDAITRKDGIILDRISTALSLCNVRGSEPSSILFGAEKNGAIDLIDTAQSLLTEKSNLLHGDRGRPIKLSDHIRQIAAAFRKPQARQELPQSIRGLWKADLFNGCTDTDYWIGTTLKINRKDLEYHPGLRLGIVPTREGDSDRVVKDTNKNLVICPLPYDGSFMQMFYQAWEVVQQFFKADAKVPGEVGLPRPASRQVARYLEDRRSFPVVEVIEALQPLAQPGLLDTQETQVSVETTQESQTPENSEKYETNALFAPIPTANPPKNC